jgi:hypothetical protein
VAFSAGGDGEGNPLGLMLDGERPEPPTGQEQKKAPDVPGLQGAYGRNTLTARRYPKRAKLRKGKTVETRRYRL